MKIFNAQSGFIESSILYTFNDFHHQQNGTKAAKKNVSYMSKRKVLLTTAANKINNNKSGMCLKLHNEPMNIGQPSAAQRHRHHQFVVVYIIIISSAHPYWLPYSFLLLLLPTTELCFPFFCHVADHATLNASKRRAIDREKNRDSQQNVLLLICFYVILSYDFRAKSVSNSLYNIVLL